MCYLFVRRDKESFFAMTYSPVTVKYLFGTVAFLWVALFSTAESQGETSFPLPNPNFNCTPDLYVQLPYQVYYANPGDPLCVVCNSTVISEQTMMEAFVSFVIAGSNEPFCSSVPGCAAGTIGDQLCFTEGIPVTSFGDYICRHAIDINSQCEVPFTITQAVVPEYTYSGSDETPGFVVLEQDQGLLLMPSITNEGLPPAEYVWEYSLNNTDFVQLSNQSSYEKEHVQDSDRGYYRFSAINVANQEDPFQLMYEVTVNFPPVVSVSTEPKNTDPATTNGVVVTCLVISHPALDQTSLSLKHDGMDSAPNIALSTSIEDDIAYHAMATTTVSGCPHRVYTCSATNVVGHTQITLSICNAVPSITNLMVDLMQSTNVTAWLVWTVVNEEQEVTGYKIQYRMLGGEYSTINHNNVNEHFFTVKNLQPQTFYEFRISASNAVGMSPYTLPVNFTTYSQPTVQPRKLRVQRFLAGGGGERIALNWSAVNSTELYTVTAYQVEYYSSVAPVDRFLRWAETLEFMLSTTEVMVGQTYFFRVRAVGEYGVGPFSAEVLSPPLDHQLSVDDIFNISITRLLLKGDQAYMAWSISGSPNPEGFFVNISQLDLDSRVILPVRNIPLTSDITEACFSDLNITDRYQYQFCVTASLPDGTMQYTCRFPDTTSDLPNTEIDCISVTENISSSAAIPEWAIATIAAGSVLAVVVVFGGCGLYVAVKRRSGQIDFKEEEPYSSFGLDKDMPGVINGGFSSRSVSPPRSCMQSYRHNNHQHQMEWQINNPMDMTATPV